MENAAPVGVSRVAVRYINRLHIPDPCGFDDYVSDPPILSEGAPSQLTAYFKRISAHDPDSGISANVAQAVEPSAEPTGVTFLLDIDVYRLLDMDPRAGELRGIFTQLQEVKNRIFFGAITDRTAEMYE